MYRLTVISDIHGDTGRLERLVPEINASDMVVFCGDGASDYMNVRGRITVPAVCVRGNNDFNTFLDDTVCVDICGVRTLVTHGHRYGVKRGIGVLQEAAINKNCDLVFFGHTHLFCDGEVGGVRMINPGALYSGSYAAVEFDGGEIVCTRHFIR